MKILLDTHIIIWFLEDNNRLKRQFIDLIVNPLNVIYFSPVSIAEMAIKSSKNKLKYPDDIIKICIDEGFEELGLTSKHCVL
jgi:PIN domain nuclease of toxin-antitoxin system